MITKEDVINSDFKQFEFYIQDGLRQNDIDKIKSMVDSQLGEYDKNDEKSFILFMILSEINKKETKHKEKCNKKSPENICQTELSYFKLKEFIKKK